MSGLHVSQEHYEGSYTTGPIDVVPEEDTNEIVELQFDSDMAFRVLEEFDESEIQCCDSEKVLVSARMPEGRWLYAYLMSFGSSVKVLKPDYMRETLAADAKRIYESNS